MRKLFGQFIAVGIIAFLYVQPVHGILLSLVPPSATVTTGSTVNVDVRISGLGNPPSVGAFDLNVGFDPTILSPTTVTFGSFLGDPLLFEALPGFDFGTPGIVEFAEVSLLSPAELNARQSSSFLLATLSFNAIAGGTSPFIFVGDQRVDDAFGAKLALPEPPTLILVGTALIGLIGWRCRRTLPPTSLCKLCVLSTCVAFAMASAIPVVAAPTDDETTFKKLIADLESPVFKTREDAKNMLIDEAAKSIANQRLIIKLLRMTLATKPNLELVRRIEGVVETIVLFFPHFKCFAADGPVRNITVKATSQFRLAKEVKALFLTRLCAPALKLKAGTIMDPDDAAQQQQLKQQLAEIESAVPHLAQYLAQTNSTEDLREIRNYSVRTQVGGAIGQTANVRYILVPGIKTTPPAEAEAAAVPKEPHYLCKNLFDSNGRDRLMMTGQFDLYTQFGSERRKTVVGPEVLCAPAIKYPASVDPEDVQKRKLRELEDKWPHLACFPIRDGEAPDPTQKKNLRTQFASEKGTDDAGIPIGRAQFLCMPVIKSNPSAPLYQTGLDKEIDIFPRSTAQVTITTPFGSDTVMLTGGMTVFVDPLPIDADDDGLEEIRTEIVRLELTGTSSLLGPLVLRLRSPEEHPFETSTGEIEETSNLMPGRLDIPPFAPSGTANSFFDVFFEIELLAPPSFVPPGLTILHNALPKRMVATISHKPPLATETYVSREATELFDEANQPTGITIIQARHTPGRRLCKADAGADIMLSDITAIFALRNRVASAGDPLDADSDGLITVNDARVCALECLKPNCAQ